MSPCRLNRSDLLHPKLPGIELLMYNSKMKRFRVYLKCIENFPRNTKQLFHTHQAFNNICERANPSQIQNSIFPLGFLINYLFNF